MSRENKTDESQEQSVVLEIRSNVEASNTEDLLKPLLDRAEKIEADERNRDGNNEQIASKKNDEPVWEKYAKKGQYWRNLKSTEVETTTTASTVAPGPNPVIKILELVSQVGGYAIKIIISYFTKDYGSMLSGVLKIIEIVVDYFLNRK